MAGGDDDQTRHLLDQWLASGSLRACGACLGERDHTPKAQYCGLGTPKTGLADAALVWTLGEVLAVETKQP